MQKIIIPLDVPKSKKAEYEKNFRLMTGGTGNLLLIAGDQKVEHLNDDFFGVGISKEDASPEHLFSISESIKNGVLATHLGLIAKYGTKYNDLPYIVKINAKTNIGKNEEKNSSAPWWTVEDVVKFKNDSKLKIAALGYTIYIGSKYEAEMLREAAQMTFKAHQNGLLSVIWMYPRAKGINEENIHTIAGGAGVAAAIGADFVKVKYPYGLKDKKKAAKNFQEVVLAAGRTRVVCVGGSKRTEKDILEHLKLQKEISNSNGIAIGRNLHQRSKKDASELGNKIAKILF